MVRLNLIGRSACKKSQGFVVIGTSLRAISVVPRVCFTTYHLRSVAWNIGILKQNTWTMKWLQSFWNAYDDPLSAIRNVKVNIGYEPSAKSIMKVPDSGSLDLSKS